MSFGRAGKILFINLTERSFNCERTEKYLSYLGGRGINQWLLFNYINPKVNPLDPESIIIFSGD